MNRPPPAAPADIVRPDPGAPRRRKVPALAAPARPELVVDLGALARNWRALAARAPTAETAAVVKADAYGCGLAPSARALHAAGARTFFVAQAEEGAALREILGEAPVIHVLNGFSLDDAATVKARRLSPVLVSLPQISAWLEAFGEDPEAEACGLHLESGINRMALTSAELDALRRDPPPGLRVQLLMSHLACADDPDDSMNGRQRGAFAGRSALARPIAPGARRSLAATGGVLLGPAFHLDLTRPGVGLFGGLPFAEAEPVAHLSAPLLQLREIAEGETVGYGASWTAHRPTRLGVLPVGYADGFFRGVSGARVFLDGRPAPVVGRVSMDMITVDLTDHPAPAPGAMVEILGHHQRVDDLAAAAGTIGYEILTSLGDRYRRRWVGGPED